MTELLSQIPRWTGDQVAQGTIGVLVALAVVLIAGFLVERSAPRARGAVTASLVALTLVSVVAYPRFGRLHGSGSLVHGYEQFHFYLGSKYLREVRYDGLYPATLVAWEEIGRPAAPAKARDVRTYDRIPATELREFGEDVRLRFSDERWAAFKDDLQTSAGSWRTRPATLMTDYSNTGSPAWAMVALVATGTLTPDAGGALTMALSDTVLLSLLFLGTWRVLNLRAACISLCMALLAVRAFGYLGGSILRLDWLFAAASAALLAQRGRHRIAGLLLGYAIASKPFCALFALALGFHMIGRALRERRIPRDAVETVLAAVLGLVAAVAASSVVFGGFDIWTDYWHRVEMILDAPYYKGQYSLRDVGYQLGHDFWGTVTDLTPKRVWSSRNRDPSSMQTGVLWGLRAALVAALGVVAARRDQVTAVGVGGLLIFVMLVSNIYYWQMFLLIGMGWAARCHSDGRSLAIVLALLLFQISTWAQILLDLPVRLQGYQGSLGMVLVIGVVLVAELVPWPGAAARASRSV